MLKWGEQNSCVKGGIVMTRRIMCLIVAMALAALIMGGALAEPLKKVMMVDFCEEWVSLRDAPSTAGKRLAQVPLYALVTDAETSPAWGDFTYCRYDGNTATSCRSTWWSTWTWTRPSKPGPTVIWAFRFCTIPGS